MTTLLPFLYLTKKSMFSYLQKDLKVVEVMRDKRKQENLELTHRHKKMLEWEAEKKKIAEKKVIWL